MSPARVPAESLSYVQSSNLALLAARFKQCATLFLGQPSRDLSLARRSLFLAFSLLREHSLILNSFFPAFQMSVFSLGWAGRFLATSMLLCIALDSVQSSQDFTSTVEWGSLTATSLAAVPPLQFSSVSDSQIQSIPPAVRIAQAHFSDIHSFGFPWS